LFPSIITDKITDGIQRIKKLKMHSLVNSVGKSDVSIFLTELSMIIYCH
jgi:hypothetical protein